MQYARLIAAAAVVAMASMCTTGCGPTNVYSWKPQAATSPRARARPTVKPIEPTEGQIGANLLDEAYREAKVTWVAVPTPDGKRMRWVKVQ